MAALTRIMIVCLLAWPAPLMAGDVGRWRPYVEEASSRFGVPAEWIESVLAAESGGHTRLSGAPITSPAGAMGLMQLMPATWREIRETLGLGSDPHDPEDNILAGTYYLRLMYERFGYPGLFAAYNAGPRRYEQHLDTGQALPAETRAYVAAVAPSAPPMRPSGSGWASRAAGLFFKLSSAPVKPGED